MTLLTPQTGNIPLPHPSAISQPYWDGCRRGELLFQRCVACKGITHTPAMVCAHCFSRDLTWERSAGTGEIYSWSTVWRPQTPAFTVPYIAVIVDMDEGWQMLANLIGVEHDAAEVGMRVEVVFHPLSGEGGESTITLPYFRPA
jgi:uncharacterized OB-fold protein